ncbi:hypothetical protein B0H13DRAFT_1904066 [Mycena leptocephala]|nr:hypothetical protein B0H13DRAFT_1904066 [Mycena leptocephala]
MKDGRPAAHAVRKNKSQTKDSPPPKPPPPESTEPHTPASQTSLPSLPSVSSTSGNSIWLNTSLKNENKTTLDASSARSPGPLRYSRRDELGTHDSCRQALRGRVGWERRKNSVKGCRRPVEGGGGTRARGRGGSALGGRGAGRGTRRVDAGSTAQRSVLDFGHRGLGATEEGRFRAGGRGEGDGGWEDG